MKKQRIIIATIILIIGGAIAFLMLSEQDETATQPTSSQTSNSEDLPTVQPEGEASSGGSYVEYSEDYLAETSGTRLLFFHAPWCPQCRALESDINSAGVPEGVTIVKVDYDSNQSLRQQYDVRIQTTVVRVDDEGNAVESFVPYDNPSLDAVVAELL